MQDSSAAETASKEPVLIVHEPGPEPRVPAYAGIIFVAACTFAVLYYTASRGVKDASQASTLLSLPRGDAHGITTRRNITVSLSRLTENLGFRGAGASQWD